MKFTMRNSSYVSACLLAMSLFAAGCSPAEEDARVERLLSQMTLQEKIGQMNQLSVAGLTPDMEALKQELIRREVPADHIPDLFYIDDFYEYILPGEAEWCVLMDKQN